MSKWFYEAQSAATKQISEDYKDYTCNFQDILSNRVHEQFTVWTEDGSPYLVHLTIYKGVNNVHYTIFTTETTLNQIERDSKK